MVVRWKPVLAWTLLTLLPGIAAGQANEAAWPTHGGSAARNGSSTARVEFPVDLAWTHRPSARPAPAWPPPARGSYWQRLSRIEPRVVDDRTFSLVCVDGAVLYASSADDSLHCMDARTGTERWHFTTDGPLRYAPFVEKGTAYFGSDDGCVYAVNTTTGQLSWKHRVAPDLRIAGNGRVISAWPVRSGVLVDNGTVYAAAGLFPSQDVFVIALAANDGREIWRRTYDYSFQGYLAAAQGRLYVPNGRAQRIAMDASDGKILGGFSGQSGSYAVIIDDLIVTGRGNNGFVSISELDGRRLLGIMPARHVTADDQRLYLLGRGKLIAVDRRKLRSLIAELDSKGETLTQLQRRTDLWNDLSVWQIETDDEECLAVCANAVFVGGQRSLQAYTPDTGSVIWRGEVDGAAQGIALVENRVLVSTDDGTLHCFASDVGRDDDRASDSHATTADRVAERPHDVDRDEDASEACEKLLERLGDVTKGICLVAGLVDGQLAVEIARRTELRVVVVDPDPLRVAAARRLAQQHGLYGHRVAVHQVDRNKLPFTDYLANVVTSERAVLSDHEVPWSAAELGRVLRPNGGVQWMGREAVRRGPLPGAGSWTNQYANPANTANSNDRHVQRDVRLQWFGGPGPGRIVDRHLRSHAPLVSNGVLVIPGENVLIGVDAYNGTELWQLDLPRSHRYSIPYDAGYIALHDNTLAAAVGDSCWLVDIRNGERSRVLNLNDIHPELAGMRWSYTYLGEDQIVAGMQHAQGLRTSPSRELIDADYRNETPLITSRHLLSCSPQSGQEQWMHSAGLVINPTITIAKDRVYFIESRNAALLEQVKSAFRLEELLAADAYLVALDLRTGRQVWQQALDEYLLACRSILYLQCAGDRLIACGSYLGDDNDTRYRIAVLHAGNGEVAWKREHAEGKPGAFSHGEQVHHPVVIGDRLIAEPVIYDLPSGQRVAPSGVPQDWRIVRPGHSCGTMSASARCLFFRANNPTLFDFAHEGDEDSPFVKLSPSRPGCWINIIPAAGLVLIPEASASCVCDYPLQTSMAFLPQPHAQ